MELVDPGVIAVIVLVTGFVGKLIPDTATGVFGIIRKVMKIIGLYISNRETEDDAGPLD